ncbi:MAG TPA: 1-(5-phosphoribosyl)-5-[(5-phosphoribosylamino)methylideneamino] imidazole-4-carboxamide isomerase [bacterium]|nr:1-(5-phosphoribosyl)-5-[(5-phosphoribosylamino)methylideneamino] imidazole-4-carboxamide isomerase [bacterium]
MIVIPAIDLLNGACVRLTRGQLGTETVYSREPKLVAQKWERLGAQRLHIVDLNGAFSGRSHGGNIKVVAEIIKTVTIPVQFGGGVRNLEQAQRLLDLGVQWVIMSTALLQQKDAIQTYAAELGERLLVAVDSRKGKLLQAGWTEEVDITPAELVSWLAKDGIKHIIYTGASKDGTMAGPDLEGIQSVLMEGIQVIAAGGIGAKKHLTLLRKGCPGLHGIILGKALYTQKLTLEEALDSVKGG